MQNLLRKYAHLYDFGHILISLLFLLAAFSLIVISTIELLTAVNPMQEMQLSERFNGVLDTISLLVIAAASLALGQTFLEEEVLRGSLLSSPTRVRHFVSRFMIVIVVALSIESLIAVFHYNRETPQFLPHAAAVGIAAAALLVSWGVFVRQNTSAERLEPEAIDKILKQEENLEEGINLNDE
jgi:hypothetical protein